MQTIKHILVVLDRDHAQQIAFDRALQLARSLDAKLTLITNAWDAYGDNNSLDLDTREQLQGGLISQAEHWLHSFVHDDNGIALKTLALWHKHLHEAVLDAMRHDDYDLVVKGTGEHHLMDRIFTHVDWNLIRHCPAPVMLVKSSQPWQHNRLLACIDAASTDDGHVRINDNILAFAENLSDHFDTDLHLINAYPMVNVAFTLLPEISTSEDIHDFIHKQHVDACSKWGHKYNVSADHIHVQEGDADIVVPTLAKDIEADLLVIGSVGRTGLAGVLIGNTAELLVDKVNCDVLVIKPNDGVSSKAD